jgi:hypothetical protein
MPNRDFFQQRWNLFWFSALKAQDGLHDPLSPSIPDFKTPPRRGFLFTLRRVPGIDGIWCLQLAVFGHLGGICLAFFSTRAQMLPRNIVLGRPVIIAALADLGFLANGLTHDLHLSDGGGRHPRRNMEPAVRY